MHRDEVEVGRVLRKDRGAAPRTTFPGLLRLVASCVIVGAREAYRRGRAAASPHSRRGCNRPSRCRNSKRSVAVALQRSSFDRPTDVFPALGTFARRTKQGCARPLRADVLPCASVPSAVAKEDNCILVRAAAGLSGNTVQHCSCGVSPASRKSPTWS
jgi:hypothetical protein